MRDESVAVAGELTGKLNHKCFYCPSRHLTKRSIGSCARRFVKEVFGQPTISSGGSLTLPNMVEMAKRGLTELGVEYLALREQAFTNSHWTPNWQDFVLCENTTEAYELAKKRLSEWRDESFAAYENARVARNRCKTEFDDMFAPDKSVMTNPKPVIVVKATAVTGGASFTVNGVQAHVWDAVAFYRRYWPVDGNIYFIDVDLHRNMLMWEERGNFPQYGLLTLNPNGTNKSTKLKITKHEPIENL